MNVDLLDAKKRHSQFECVRYIYINKWDRGAATAKLELIINGIR